MELAIRQTTSLSVAEAVAVLLQTWNRAYYQYHPFTGQHFADIETAIANHYSDLLVYRERSLESLQDSEQGVIVPLVRHFDCILGPVGTAKCLHLLAPRFFVLWDNAIASAFRLRLHTTGQDSERYFQFMRVTKDQVIHLGGEGAIGRNPLKALDEYNYCKHTKGWI